MQKVDKYTIAGLIMCLVLWAWMSNEDYKEQVRSEEHAAYLKQLAAQEEAERKAEWNALAKRGEYMTGIEAKK